MPTTLRNTDILFNDGTTQSTAAGAPVVAAGTNYFPTNTLTARIDDNSMQRRTFCRIWASGTIRVRWGIYVIDAYNNRNIVTRVYKNGVAQGTERNFNGASDVAYTEDISVAVGDRIELWARSANAPYGIQGLLIGVAAFPSSNAVGTQMYLTNALSSFC